MEERRKLEMREKVKSKKKTNESQTLPPYEDRHLGNLLPQGFPPVPKDWDVDWKMSRGQDVSFFQVCLKKRELWLSARSRASEAERQRPIRILIGVHGLGEHSGRYFHFPHFLQNSIDACFFFDLRGHGRSEGIRGHIERFSIWVEDLKEQIKKIQEEVHQSARSSAQQDTEPLEVEFHLFGHSLGGLIVLHFLKDTLEHPMDLKSVTVSAPALEAALPLPLVKRAGAQLLSRVWGSVHLENEIDAQMLSHDPEVVKAYRQDKLVHSKGTPRVYTELTQAMAEMRKTASLADVPLLLLLPEKDAVVSTPVAQDFFQKLKLRDKKCVTFPDFFHESFNEFGKEAAFKELEQWIQKHSSFKSEN